MSTDLRERLLEWLDASPTELAGLTVLLAGSVLAMLVLIRSAPPVADAPSGAGPAVVVSEPSASLTVHVVGEVVAPGVVALDPGARVRDAISAAGGATVVARLDAVNLARPVHDGEQLVVPGPTDDVAGPGRGEADGGGAVGADGRVDLNRATAAELEALPGIGPVLAERIVAHREANGPFDHPGALREVPGIGERTFQSLVELVVVR